jgi:hypothetical protein
LILTPISPEDAVAFAQRYGAPHAARGLYACALAEAGDGPPRLRAVALVDYPALRPDPYTLELTALATEGDPLPPRLHLSQLYGAARRVAWGLGYRRLYRCVAHRDEIDALQGAGWHHATTPNGAPCWEAPPY